MPNWVKNKVKFGTDKVLMDCIIQENGRDVFDFNKIIPMPKEFANEEEYEKLTMEEKILFKNKWGEEYGWYEWSVEHWGTKWNSSETYTLNDKEVVFETAWSMPDPVFKEISKKYNTTVEVEYADECIVENSGISYYEEGYEIDYEQGDEELYNRVWGA